MTPVSFYCNPPTAISPERFSHMRELIAYILSAFLHGSVIGTLMLWQSLWPEFSFSVRSGQSVSTITLTAAVASERVEAAEIETEIITELAPTLVEIVPTSKAANEPEPVEMEPDPLNQAVAMVPLKQKTVADPPREPALPSPSKVPPQKTKRAASVASAAMDFQAATELGVEVDQLPRKLSTNAPPAYPVEALLAKMEGRVVLLVRVLSNGTVSQAKIDQPSGFGSLDQAALTAVLQWKFEPARRAGIAVEHEVLVPVSFSIKSR